MDNLKANLEYLAHADLGHLIFAVDFDGTCVTHEFPSIGTDVPHAVDVLKALTTGRAKIILWTVRSDAAFDGTSGPNDVEAREYLRHAQEWFGTHDIELHGINENPQQKDWSSSPKCYAHVYIDDAALGCPLIFGEHVRPYVDWKEVAEQLANQYGK